MKKKKKKKKKLQQQQQQNKETKQKKNSVYSVQISGIECSFKTETNRIEKVSFQNQRIENTINYKEVSTLKRY